MGRKLLHSSKNGKEKAKEQEKAGKGRGAMKRKGKNDKGHGRFICGSTANWSKECPQAKQINAVTDKNSESGENGQTEEWTEDWSWYCHHYGSWSSKWIGACPRLVME